jgi:general stress protein CsbA
MASIRAKKLIRRKRIVTKLLVIAVLMSPLLCILIYTKHIPNDFIVCIPITCMLAGFRLVLIREHEEEMEKFS